MGHGFTFPNEIKKRQINIGQMMIEIFEMLSVFFLNLSKKSLYNIWQKENEKLFGPYILFKKSKFKSLIPILPLLILNIMHTFFNKWLELFLMSLSLIFFCFLRDFCVECILINYDLLLRRPSISLKLSVNESLGFPMRPSHIPWF